MKAWKRRKKINDEFNKKGAIFLLLSILILFILGIIF